MAIPTSLIRPVQAAITSLVEVDATFISRCAGGIVDIELEGQTYPFVLVLSMEEPWNTMGGRTSGNGREIRVVMHIYSRYEGAREALMIQERLIELLDFAELVVPGYQTVMLQFIRGKVLVEDRNKLETRHIPCEITALVHE